MGNRHSKISSKIQNDVLDMSPTDTMDYISGYYILTEPFSELSQLNEKDNYDELFESLSDIVDKNFTDTELSQLLTRVLRGSNKGLHDEATDQQYNELKRSEKCNKISNFYIKIAQVFSIIMSNINPTMLKNNFLKDEKREQIISTKKWIVDLSTLFHKFFKDVWDADLIDLYYDDGYDYKTSTFTTMSVSNARKLNNDLKTFYTEFTGEREMPDAIKTFSDLHLEELYQKIDNSDTLYEFGVHDCDSYSDDDSELFSHYAIHMKYMVQCIYYKQKMLLEIMNTLFSYVNQESDELKIHSELSEMSLQHLFDKTKNIVLEMYLECETHYAEIIKIYEAIVENQIYISTQNQIKALETSIEQLMQM
jgi:hypothetical protein